jgi:hypothetical protein
MAFERLKQLKFYPAEKIDPNSEAKDAVQALADYEAGVGDVAGGIQTYEVLLQRMQQAKSGLQPDLEDAVHLSNIYRAAAELYWHSHQTAKADNLRKRRLDLWWQWDQKLPNNAFVRRQFEAARQSRMIAKN